MKIEVLSIGSFPEATNAELANRFTVTRYLRQPVADALGANLKNRIRAIATEANHGAARALGPRARSSMSPAAAWLTSGRSLRR